MNEINIGVYIDSTKDLNIFSKLLSFLKIKYNIVSAHIFSDTVLDLYIDAACLSTFYMSYYRNSLLFTNLEDFLANQYNIISSDIYVITDANQLEQNHITRQDLKNIKLLLEKDGEFHEI